MLALVTLAGCIETEIQRDGGGAREVHEDGRSWTPPMHFRGIPFRFELMVGENPRWVLPTDTNIVFGIQGRTARGLEYRHQRFYLRGRVLKLEKGYDTLIYIPPTEDEPWQLQFDQLNIIWYADGTRPVVMQKKDYSATWYIGHATIELTKGGRLTHQHPRGKTYGQTPSTLYLDAGGALTTRRDGAGT